MITSVAQMVESYVNAWNKESLAEFKIAFAECLATDIIYIDPNYELTGAEAIIELAQASLEKIPTRKFKLLTQPEHHHYVGRYYWQVALPDGERDGFDYFEFNDQFQITRLVSFFKV